MRTNHVMMAVLAVIVLLVVGQYFLLPMWYRDQGIRPSGWMIMASIAMGIVLNIVTLNYVIKKLLNGQPLSLLGLSTAAPNGTKIGSYLAGYASYPFALFMGFVVGGNLGGALGDLLGIGDTGIIVGIGLGLFIVSVLICVFFVVVGFVIGGFTEKLVRGKQDKRSASQ